MADPARVIHGTLTLSASAQSLAVAFPDITGPVRLRAVYLQAGAANVNPFFVGGAGVTITNFGIRVPAPVTGEPSAPLPLDGFEDGTVELPNIFLVGTAAETVKVLAFAYF